MRARLVLCLAFLVISDIKCLDMAFSDHTVLLNCFKTESLDDRNTSNTQHVDTQPVEEVIVESCSPPSDSYTEVLKSMKVDVADIKKLVLRNLQLTDGHNSSTGSDLKRLQSQHFNGLQLDELQILNDDTTLSINLDFLKDLSSLTKLSLNKVDVESTFPELKNLRRLDISNGLFHGNIDDCSKLKFLHLNKVELVDSKNKWLQNCYKLDTLLIEHLSDVATGKILSGISYSIRNITARYCSVNRFPDSIHLIDKKDLRSGNIVLRHLDLSHNNIKYLPTYSQFYGLETLDVSYNKLTHFDKYYLYSDYVFPNLRELKLDGNDFSDSTCKGEYANVIRQTKEDDRIYRKELDSLLRHLSIADSKIQHLCFGKVLLPKLESFNVSRNNLNELNYRLFYWTSSDHLEVDMRQNPIKKVAFTQDDYESMRRNDPAVTRWSKMTVLTDARLPCDCSLAWFARALRERLFFVEGASCEDGSSIENMSC